MQNTDSSEEAKIYTLYQQLLKGWNNRRASDMAALFTDKGNLVGFDGSPLNGRTEIEAHLREIFADHPTAAFVTKVREVRFLTPNVAMLRGVAGMVPPGQSELNAAANAIQTIVASRHGGAWQIEMFQNTPAAFHGRPGLSQALTEELQQLL